MYLQLERSTTWGTEKVPCPVRLIWFLIAATQFVWYTLAVVETLLAVRFLFKLLQANPAAAFTDIVYSLSGIFVLPFVAVFQNMRVENSVFEWTTLLAMLVYWLLALAIIKLFIMSKSVSSVEADQKLAE